MGPPQIWALALLDSSLRPSSPVRGGRCGFPPRNALQGYWGFRCLSSVSRTGRRQSRCKRWPPLVAMFVVICHGSRAERLPCSLRSFKKLREPLRGCCRSLFSLNCVAFPEGALMSVSNFAIQTPIVLFSMRTYEFLKTHVLTCHHWQ